MTGRHLAWLAALTAACSTAPEPARNERTPGAMTPMGADTDDVPASTPDFGNASTPVPIDAASGSGAEETPSLRGDCSPGFYLGTYACDVNFLGLVTPLEGDVSFNLEINEEVLDGECPPGSEFCADLVIAEGSGTLFGLAGGFGFEAPLAGGLDCGTGAFRTESLDGIYGPPVSSDPSDPNALWTVAQPPFGSFVGSLQGAHEAGTLEAINGEWMLVDNLTGSSCTGSFGVQLQP